MAHQSAVSRATGSYNPSAIAVMSAMHVVGLAAFWVAPASWPLIALCVASYYVRMFAITAGYHRYFAHRAYRTSRAGQFLLALLGGMSAQRGALWWAAHHRDHHRYSDQPGDVHSPVLEGFWWSHIGWIVHRSSDATAHENVRDFAKFPELQWLDRWHLAPPVLLATALFLIGGVPALFWGFFLPTVLLWHGTFVINSLAHVWGSRRYPTADASRNNAWLAVLTLGEGWHNNHHHYQSAARQGFFWWEVDVSYLVLRTLAWCGVVWQLKAVPERVLHPAPGSAASLAAAPGEPLGDGVAEFCRQAHPQST